MEGKVDITAFLSSLHNEALPAVRLAAADLVNQFAWSVIGESVPLCPVKEGHLAASADVFEEASGAAGRLVATIGYNTDYAQWVHENIVSVKGNLIFHSQGQAKFLEAPMKRKEREFPGFMIGGLKAAVGGDWRAG